MNGDLFGLRHRGSRERLLTRNRLDDVTIGITAALITVIVLMLSYVPLQEGPDAGEFSRAFPLLCVAAPLFSWTGLCGWFPVVAGAYLRTIGALLLLGGIIFLLGTVMLFLTAIHGCS